MLDASNTDAITEQLRKRIEQEGLVPVLTMPEAQLSGFQVKFPGIVPTSVALRVVMNSAKDDLLVSAPFIEEHGVLLYADLVRRLARERVFLRCLTREYESNLQVQKAIRRLADIYLSWGDASRLQIRDYHVQLGDVTDSVPSTDDRFHYESVHAKIMIADNSLCYLGSAELRMNSLFANFEAGVILGGDLVKTFREAFYHIWKAARPIALQGPTKAMAGMKGS
jgi:phosphatidylserine/phosphatidylglycerophosphate/cardiolipin synthase-like enzyme